MSLRGGTPLPQPACHFRGGTPLRQPDEVHSRAGWDYRQLCRPASFAYAQMMRPPAHRPPSLLRAALLALLMLGVMIKPVLAPLCDIHALGHELRVYQHEPGNSLLQNAERQFDQHAADGAHGLVHEGDSGSAYADNTASIVLIAVRFDAVRLQLPPASHVPLQSVGAPFRPPIG